MSTTRKIALLLRGISFSDGYCTTNAGRFRIDAREALATIDRHVVQSLRNHGHPVDVYVSTNEHPFLSEFFSRFAVMAMRTFQIESSTETENLVEGLTMIDPTLYDTIAVMRVDVHVKVDVMTLDIDFEKINFLWDEIGHYRKTYRTANVLWIYPSHVHGAFMQSLGESAANHEQKDFPTHLMARYLCRHVDPTMIHFMIPGSYASAGPNPFYQLRRTSPTTA